MNDTSQTVEVDKTSTTQMVTPQEQTTHLSNEPKPDLELLMFLAEWDEYEGDQWVGPDAFADDSAFNQQLDNNKATKHEEDPDNP